MKAKLNFNHLGKFIQSKKIKDLVCWDVGRNIEMYARTHNDKQAATVRQQSCSGRSEGKEGEPGTLGLNRVWQTRRGGLGLGRAGV